MPHTVTMAAKVLDKLREAPTRLWTATALATACGYAAASKGQVSSALRTLEREGVARIARTVTRASSPPQNFWTLA